MDAIELLKKDHQRVTELFRRFNGGVGLTGIVNRFTGNVSERQRRAAAEQICNELELHTRIEEEVFYPAVRSLDDEELNEMLNGSYQEHGTVKEEVAVIRRGIGKDPDLQAKMNEMQSNVDHHVREEEGEMFPRVVEMMDGGRRAELGRELQARKRQTATPPARAGRRSRSTAGAKQAPTRRTTTARAKARKGVKPAARGRARAHHAK